MAGFMIARRKPLVVASLGIVLALGAEPAHAYIGPGAGFAFVGSLVVLLTTFVLALAIILTWPIRLLTRWLTVGDPSRAATSPRVAESWGRPLRRCGPRARRSRSSMRARPALRLC